jgi:hypothetical protein
MKNVAPSAAKALAGTGANGASAPAGSKEAGG